MQKNIYNLILKLLSPFKGFGLREYSAIRFILSYLRPTKAIVNGFDFKLDRTDETISRMLIAGDYESFETEIIKELVKKDFYILDIGANIGYYTLLFSNIVGKNGKVFAFEPTPKTYKLLKFNLKQNKLESNVETFNLGVSNENAKARFYINNYNKGDNRLYGSGNMKSIEVDLVKLDEKLNNIEKLDFIKMDIQGAEGLAINGMLNLLNKFKPIIVMEFWPIRLKRLNIDPIEMLKKLENIGYSFQDIREDEKKILDTTVDELIKNYPENTELATNIICKIR